VFDVRANRVGSPRIRSSMDFARDVPATGPVVDAHTAVPLQILIDYSGLWP